MSPELLGVVIGGGIGLATAAVAQLFAWFQMKSARAFALRQAVYLESAVTLANSVEFFSNVHDLQIDDGVLADLVQPTSAAMFKIHVVGTPATIAALSEANQQLTGAATELMRRRATLRAAIDAAGSDTESSALARLHKELLLDSLRAGLQYQRCLAEVNISARRELGLPLDEAGYREVNMKAEHRIAAIIQGAVNDLAEPSPEERRKSSGDDSGLK